MSYEAELMIGYGSSLRGDDRAGLEAAERLARMGHHALPVSQLTPELAAAVAGASQVIFLDASADVEPGEIRTEAVEPDSGTLRPFEHASTPARVLQLARECYGWKGTATLIAIGGDCFELSEELSPSALLGVERAVELSCALSSATPDGIPR